MESGWKESQAGKPQQVLRQQLQRDYHNLHLDAVALLNQSLQINFTRDIFASPSKDEAYEVNGVAVDRDTKLLAAGCGDGQVRLWKLDDLNDRSLKPLLVSFAQNQPVAISDVAFGGPDGNWLAAACGAAGVFVWLRPIADQSPALILPKAGASGSWTRVAWDPRSPRLLAACAGKDEQGKLPADGGLQAWLLASDGQSVTTLPLADERGERQTGYTAVTFQATRKPEQGATRTEDDRLFAARANDGRIFSWVFGGSAWGPALPLRSPVTRSGQDADASDANPLLWDRLATGFLETSEKTLPVLVAAGGDGRASMWTLNGETQVVLRHPCPVRGVALSPQGNALATAGRDAKVRYWRFPKRREHTLRLGTDRLVGDPDSITLNGHKKKLTQVIFGRKGKEDDFLVSSGDEKGVRLWGLSRRGPAFEFGLFDLAWFSFHPTLDWVAGCEREPTDANSGYIIRKLQGASQFEQKKRPVRVRRLAFHPNGERLATLELNEQHHDPKGTFRIWPKDDSPALATVEVTVIKSETENTILPLSYGKIEFGASGRLVAFSMTEDSLWAYALADKGLSPVIEPITDAALRQWNGDNKTHLAVYGFALDETRDQLALACSEGVVFVVDLNKPTAKPARFEVPNSPAVNAVCFNPAGTHLALGCADASIRIIDLGSRQMKQVLAMQEEADQKAKPSEVHKSEVKCISFHPGDETELASAGDDGLLCVWKLQQDNNWHLQYRFDTGGPIQAMRYNQAGNRLGIATSTGQVRVYWFDAGELKEVADERLKGLGQAYANP